MTNTWKVEKVGNGTDPTLARVKFGPTINDDTWGWAEIVGVNAHAHANLIAAAPDLLAALKDMFKAADEVAAEFIQKKRAAKWDIINDAYVKAERAIAKAEGADNSRAPEAK
jgi:hypothetical protein